MGVSICDENRKTIGIIGLGSIGIKHCESLKLLGVKKILAFRTNKGKKQIPESLLEIVENIDSLDKFKNVDAIIIANPTSLHIKTIEQIIHLNKTLFIEKPLSEKNIDSAILNKLINYKKKIQIGFCLRYHSVIRKSKEIIDSGMLGEIYYANLQVGQFLPQWHPYTDYRTEYFSNKNLGGGAIRTLSHEIDLAQYFFGNPKSLKSFQGKVSNLEIDVDDLSILFLKYENKIVKIEIDFLQKNPKRIGMIHGEDADLEYNIFKNTICVYNKMGEIIYQENIESDDMYAKQMEAFIGFSDKNFASLQESIIQMKIIQISEIYNEQSYWINI